MTCSFLLRNLEAPWSTCSRVGSDVWAGPRPTALYPLPVFSRSGTDLPPCCGGPPPPAAQFVLETSQPQNAAPVVSPRSTRTLPRLLGFALSTDAHQRELSWTGQVCPDSLYSETLSSVVLE